jgi:hypothetical protein
MSDESAILSMIQSIRENRRLIHKQKNRPAQEVLSNDSFHYHELHFRESSPEETKKLKERLIHEMKLNQQVQYILLAIAIISAFLFLYLIIS